MKQIRLEVYEAICNGVAGLWLLLSSSSSLLLLLVVVLTVLYSAILCCRALIALMLR